MALPKPTGGGSVRARAWEVTGCVVVDSDVQRCLGAEVQGRSGAEVGECRLCLTSIP